MSALESEPQFVFTKKLEAAVRQLETAIWLWFNGGDLVSINTLAGAAHGVLDDLMHHSKKGRAVPFETPPEGMNEKDWRKLLKAGATFAKHARTDPNETEAYSVEEAELLLFFVLLTNSKLTDGQGVKHGLRRLLIFWFVVKHPRAFDAPLPRFVRDGEKRFDVEILKKLSRIEFFREVGGEFIGNPPRPD